MNPTLPKTDYDILIVGGGLVGMSLALGFCQLPLKVGLVDASCGFSHVTPKTDGRTIALSEVSLRILQSLYRGKVASACALDGFQIPQNGLSDLSMSLIKTIHISTQHHFAMTRLCAADLDLPALAYCVEMPLLLASLYEQLAHTSCELIPAKVTGMTRKSNVCELELARSNALTSVTTKLLIAADGDESCLRGWLQMSVKRYDYQQSALVTTVEITTPHHETAFERFIDGGSVALLPIAEKKMKVVWIAKTDVIHDLALLTPDEKLRQLQTQLGNRLGHLHTLGENHFIYPLNYLHAAEQVTDNVVLMGNAAHVLHPIAAQGFNLSLRDSAVLIEVVRLAFMRQEDFFAKPILQRYADSRISSQQRVEKLTHGLAGGLIGGVFPLTVFRGLGCHVMNYVPAIRRQFTRFAMGFDPELPRWVYM